MIVNDPPVAVDDDPDPSPSATPDPSNYVVYEDTTLTVSSLNGVLSNDYDPNVPATDTLTASLVTNVTNGTLTLNPNGSFTYHPTLNYNGTDSFTYDVTDGGMTSRLATVSHSHSFRLTTRRSPISIRLQHRPAPAIPIRTCTWSTRRLALGFGSRWRAGQ